MVDLARPRKRTEQLSAFTAPNGLARSHSQRTEQFGTVNVPSDSARSHGLNIIVISLTVCDDSADRVDFARRFSNYSYLNSHVVFALLSLDIRNVKSMSSLTICLLSPCPAYTVRCWIDLNSACPACTIRSRVGLLNILT